MLNCLIEVAPIWVMYFPASNYLRIRWLLWRAYNGKSIFLDERIDRFYRAQQKLGQSLTYFSAILIFVACLGLVGLASYTAEQKTREIGIITFIFSAAAAFAIILISVGF